ncbi:protein of unknown function [Pseudonocardia ammonioxydans]|uniref:DUF1990 domain-containing protein n=1 Tax=Pseudonocardia ammonioxydans TaxID=260086 RepID=A0A1I5BCA5_PSUAM|nr:DUF1990 family protein [Pseudonocardia ammonioxydans]SFN72159.1 protein of unknown function [Pseudonocardia ammonioxydans]
MHRADDLSGLAGRPVNVDPAEAPDRPGAGWYVDHGRALVGTEPPGDPVPDGDWERACAVVRDYQFTDHRRVRGFFRPADPLLGRDMLLEGRFGPLRFHLGVRVTEVVDEVRDGVRVWGWTYDTLRGHLERGRLTYEVVKDLRTGEVEFVIRAFSRPARIPNPLYRLGFALFGRGVQLEFYHRVGQRVRDLVGAARAGHPLPRPAPGPDGVVVAPQGAPRHRTDAVALLVRHPGV